MPRHVSPWIGDGRDERRRTESHACKLALIEGVSEPCTIDEGLDKRKGLEVPRPSERVRCLNDAGRGYAIAEAGSGMFGRAGTR